MKECAGCDRTLTLKEVACWHTTDGSTTIWCERCFPHKWSAHIRAAEEKRRAGMAASEAAERHGD